MATDVGSFLAAGSKSPLPSQVAHCSFFYLDKFVLVASGRHVLLYQYQIDRLSKEALIRQHPQGRCRIVHSWEHAAQKVTSFDAFNNVLSHIFISAGSDRSVSVLDVAEGKIARVLPDTHSKPVHTVCLPKPSPYSSTSQVAYDVFATASTDNVVHLWDLR